MGMFVEMQRQVYVIERGQMRLVKSTLAEAIGALFGTWLPLTALIVKALLLFAAGAMSARPGSVLPGTD